MFVGSAVLVLAAALLAWKMKGAQIPHMLLGGMVAKQGIPIIDSIINGANDAYMALCKAIATMVPGGTSPAAVIQFVHGVVPVLPIGH